MNLHDLTEPVRAILEGAGLNYQQTIRMWNYIDEGVDTPTLDGAATRIAESILSNHLENQGDLITGHMKGESPPWYCTTFATGSPLVYEGQTKLEAMIAASASLAKEGTEIVDAPIGD